MNKFAIHITDKPITTTFGSSFSMNESSLDTELPDVTKHIKENKNDIYNNSEIEKGEVLLKNDLSSILKASGKTHAKGGIKVNLDDGDFIYSNYNKLALSSKEHKLYELKEGGSFAKGKNTPAEVLKRNLDTEHYNTMVALLQDDKKGDLISKKSAALMLNKYQETLGKVAYIQETKKNEQAPSFSDNTAPVYDSSIKKEIKQQPQYMEKGGYVKKYLTGGNDCPEGYTWDGFQCIPNNLSLPNMNPYTKAPNTDFVGAYSKSPYPLDTREGKGYTAFDREKDFNNLIEEANLLGANLPTGLNNNNIKAYQSFYANNFPDVVTNSYNNNSIAFNNKDAKNPLNTFQDGYFRKDGFGVDKTIHTFPTIEARDAYMKKFNMTPSQKDANIFYDKNKVTPNNRVTLFRTAIGPQDNVNSNAPLVQTPVPVSQMPAITPPADLSVNGKKSSIGWQFTPWQQANLGWVGLQAAKVERQFPYRPQIKSQLVDLQQLNPQAALNQVNNSTSLALKASQSMNPYLAGANMQQAVAQGMNQSASVQGQYDEKNAQIKNQEVLQNTQTLNNDLRTNIGFDKEYYDATQDSYRNYKNMKDVANNQFINQANQYASTNQALAYNQASLGPNAPYKYNFKTGQFDLTGQNPLNSQYKSSQDPVYNSYLTQFNKLLSESASANEAENKLNGVKMASLVKIMENLNKSSSKKMGGFINKPNYRTIK